MASNNEIPTWGKVQEKVFTRWVNTHLDERDLKITGLLDGSLDDGIMLWNLLEEISGKKLAKLDNNPKMRIHKINNLLLSINFIAEEDIKLVGIGPENIIDRDTQQVMGLIWTLILRWHVAKKGQNSKAAKRELIDWLNSVGIPCTNLDKDWTNGDFISRLVNVLRPNTVHPKGEPLDDTEDAIDAANKKFEIPKVLDASDMVSDNPDELVNMTYLSYFRDKWFDAQNVRVVDSTVPKSSTVGSPFEFQIEFLQGAPREEYLPRLKSPVFDSQGNVIGEAKITPLQNADRALVSFTPKDSGKQCIDVQLSGISIKGSPVNLFAGITPKVFLRVPSKLTGIVGVPVVIPMDTENVTLPMLSTKISDPNGKSLPMDLKGSGNSYTLTFVPQIKGDHLANVLLEGKEVDGSPIQIHVEPKPSLTPPKDLPDATVGVPYKFHLDAENVKPDELGLTIKDPNGNNLDLKVLPDNKGFTVEFTPKTKGVHPLDATLSGNHVDGFPIKILAKNPPKLTIDPPSFRDDAIVDSPYKIPMKSENVNPEMINVTVTDPKGNKIPSSIKKNGDDGYDLNFTPVVPGHHKVAVALNGDEVPGSPITVNAHPKPWARLALVGGGNAFVDVPFEFPIDTVNVKLNELDIKITDPKGNRINDVQVTPKPTDNTKGKQQEGFIVGFTPRIPGDFIASVDLNGKEIEGSPAKIVAKYKPKVTIPKKNYDDAIVDDPYKVVLDTVNVKPDQLEVIVTDPFGKKVPSKVSQKGPDGYDVDFTPRVPGNHTFTVKLDGDEVPGSPINIVASERPHAKINLNNLPDGVVDVPYVVPIDTVNVKPEMLNVKISDPSGAPVDAKVIPRKDDKGYDVHFTPRVPGKFTAEADLNGVPAENSPAKITVKPKPKIAIRGDKVRDGIVDQPHKIIADSENVNPDHLKLEVTDPHGNKLPATLKPNDNGKEFHIDFTPHTVGQHQVKLFHNDEPVEGAPVTVNVKPRPRAIVKAREAGDATVQVEYTLPIDTVNVTPDKLSVSVKDPTGKKVDVKLIPPTNGDRYLAKFTPQIKGKFEVDVDLKGGDVEGSPLTVLAKPKPYIKLLEYPKVAVAGTPCEFLFVSEGISPKDLVPDIQDVTKYTYPGKDVPIKVDNSRRPKNVDPDADIISMKFTPNEPIKHVVSVTCSGKEIDGFPMNLKVVPKPTIDLLLNNERGTVAIPFVFQKAVVESVSVEELTVPIHDSKGKFVGNANIKDNDDTTFDLSFTFSETGRHTAEILYNGNKVLSPFSFLVVPAEGRWGTVGELFRLPIEASNFQPSHLTFKVYPRDSPQKVYNDAQLVDSTQENAKYDVAFTPSVPGIHIMELYLQGSPIPGSPISLDVVSPPLVTLLTPDSSTQTIDQGGHTAFARISIAPTVDISSLSVPIHSNSGTVGTGRVVDRKDGSYDLVWAPGNPGSFIANVNLGSLTVCGPILFAVQIDESTDG